MIKQKADHILWSADEAAAVTGGVNTAPWMATGISLNIEDIQPGDLFVATKEDDLGEVFAKGAAAVMQVKAAPVCDKLPTLRVSNVYMALQDLAGAARFRTHASILAVQGKVARAEISAILGNIGHVQEAGRHMSLSLAALPPEAAYGVFGLSPLVKPDIAIITDCVSAHRDTLFESMPAHGTVLIHADDEDFLSILSRAKAAGIKHIYSFGKSEKADARLCSLIEGNNGLRVVLNVLGDEYNFTVDPKYEYHPGAIAALLALHLTGKSIERALQPYTFGFEQTAYAKNNVTLINPADEKAAAVFRITNMIDLGFGRQTAILDNVKGDGHKTVSLHKKGLAIPKSLANLDFVFTTKGFGTVPDASAAIRQRHGGMRVAPIVPEVATPGDFLVFRGLWDKSKSAIAEALRPDVKMTTSAANM